MTGVAPIRLEPPLAAGSGRPGVALVQPGLLRAVGPGGPGVVPIRLELLRMAGSGGPGVALVQPGLLPEEGART